MDHIRGDRENQNVLGTPLGRGRDSSTERRGLNLKLLKRFQYLDGNDIGPVVLENTRQLLVAPERPQVGLKRYGLSNTRTGAY